LEERQAYDGRAKSARRALTCPPGVASAVRYCYHLVVCEPNFELACKKKAYGDYKKPYLSQI